MTLRDRVAVVSGGASGIGAALVELLRAAGAVPVVWDVAETGDVVCDVSDPDAVEHAMAETLQSAGTPTLVTASAGIGDSATLLDTDPDAWDRIFRVNLKGAWLVMRAGARAMIESGDEGSIIAVSSVSARLSDRGMGPYCASKAALDMLVRVAACEWGNRGIRVNAVAPGVTETPLLERAAQIPGWMDEISERTPLGRPGRAEEVATVALAVHELDWVTGESIAADGGLRLHSPIDSMGAVARARRRTTTR